MNYKKACNVLEIDKKDFEKNEKAKKFIKKKI